MKDFRKTINDQFICEECGEIHSCVGKLSAHINKTHNMTIKEYYDKYLFEDGDNICKVNDCNNEVEFTYVLTHGYKRTCCRKCGSKLAGQTIKESIKNGTCTIYSKENIDKRNKTLKETIKENPNYYKERENKKKQLKKMLKIILIIGMSVMQK